MSSLCMIASLLLAIAFDVHRSGIGLCCAFHISNVHPQIRAGAALSKVKIYSSAVDRDESAKEDKTSSMMTIKFVGEIDITSEETPSTAKTDKSLRDFFALQESVLLFLRGSKNNQVIELESNENLLKQYEQMCEKVDVSPPSSDDWFFEVTTTGIKFPGLALMSVATIGAKVITDAEELPAYELVLIKDSTFAEGNRLFVWFYNKVTGKDKDNEGEVAKEPTTSSVNRISVVPKENGILSFQSNAFLSVQVQFPAFLMKAIPGASKDKFEKTGGDSLRKVLEEDCPAALEAFRQEYLRWINS